MTLTIDAWRAGRLNSWWSAWSRALVVGTTGLLGLLGLAERFHAEMVKARLVTGEAAALDALPWGRMAWDAMVVALVGLVASSYVVLSLIDEFHDKRVPA